MLHLMNHWNMYSQLSGSSHKSIHLSARHHLLTLHCSCWHWQWIHVICCRVTRTFYDACVLKTAHLLLLLLRQLLFHHLMSCRSSLSLRWRRMAIKLHRSLLGWHTHLTRCTVLNFSARIVTGNQWIDSLIYLWCTLEILLIRHRTNMTTESWGCNDDSHLLALMLLLLSLDTVTVKVTRNMPSMMSLAMKRQCMVSSMTTSCYKDSLDETNTHTHTHKKMPSERRTLLLMHLRVAREAHVVRWTVARWLKRVSCAPRLKSWRWRRREAHAVAAGASETERESRGIQALTSPRQVSRASDTHTNSLSSEWCDVHIATEWCVCLVKLLHPNPPWSVCSNALESLVV